MNTIINKMSFFAFFVIIQSCNKSPNCGDIYLNEKAIAEFNSQVKNHLINDFYNKNINKDDVKGYAIEHNLSYSELLKSEKEKISHEADLFVTKQLSETKLKNIITLSFDDKIKKCECEADIENPNLVNGIYIVYSAQKTEDNNLKIVLDYHLLNSDEYD